MIHMVQLVNYYKNLTEIHINDVLKLNSLFTVWDTYYNNESCDLYFVGIKKRIYNFKYLEKYKNKGVINYIYIISIYVFRRI